MKDESMKKQNFLQGAAILAAATLIVKLLGFLFKTPLNYIIGETGSSYFYNAYRVYDVLLMISTTGPAVAMSRMISEAQTLGNHAQIRKIYKTALYVFLTIGIVGSLGMFLFSKPLSVLVSNSETSWAAIAALAPCVLIICMISAYRGFFQGQSNMAPTSISQIFEAIIRLVIGLSLAWLLMRETGSATYAAAGGILGVTVGSFVSMVYLHGKFRQSSKILQEAGGTAKSTRATMKELLAIAIPITLGAAGLQIINLVDASIYMRRLSGALGYTATQVDTLNGIYTFQQTIFALPCSFITTITISCIPAITAALTRKDDAEAKGTEESAIRTMALIALPCSHRPGRHGGADHPPALPRLQRDERRRRDADPAGVRHCGHLQLDGAPAQRDHAGPRRRDNAGRQYADRRRREGHRELLPRGRSFAQHRRRGHRHADVLRGHHRARPRRHPAPHLHEAARPAQYAAPGAGRSADGCGDVRGLPAGRAHPLTEARVPACARDRRGLLCGAGGFAALHHLSGLPPAAQG